MPTSSETKRATPRGPLPRWAWWVLLSIVTLFVLGVGVATVAYVNPGTNIVRSVTVAGQPVGGLDTLTAIHNLDQAWQRFAATAFTIQAPGRTLAILVTADTSSDEEVVLGMVDFSSETSVNRALTFGRRGSFWQQLRERTSGFLGRPHELGVVEVESKQLRILLTEKFSDLERPAKNASLSITAQGQPTIQPSTDGQTFNYEAAWRMMVGQARRLDVTPIILRPVPTAPAIATTPQLQALASRAVPTILARAPMTLTRKDKSWKLSRAQLTKLLGFVGTTADPRVGFDSDKTAAYLATVAQEVNVPAQNAKFTMVNGRVQEFQAGQVGIKLDLVSTTATMQQRLIDQEQATAEIVTSEEQPLSAAAVATTLGITELVGEATTSFKGSPTNRRFNLSYGAKILNGLLIQPGEEFSLVKALGKIDAAHGWKSELVIKGSKITPEYGGGLCQVGTTMFRTALNTGLPIVERHNHSLRISYYEPPIGLDATIYEPKPDLRFTNDYRTPLLLQSEVEGNNLTFRFYGTKDGRTVDVPTPKVYNRVPIPATTTTEVDDLKPGVKVCQAPGHPGADATATYTVTKADGTKVTQTFQSHYRAIGVICRVGRAAAAKSTTTKTNTATLQ